ncbi:hypothetical protein Tco_0856129 [Tanacetum coccineum]
MISMFVSLDDRDFKEGNMFGSITVSDTYGLLPDGWSELSRNDVGFVSYFERHWCNPMRIKNDSFHSFGNPSLRHAVPFASFIEIRASLVVTSLEKADRKDACYTICNTRSKVEKKLKKFWQDDKQVKCDYVSFRSKDGVLRIYYILMRDAIDVTFKLRYESPLHDLEGVKVRGHVFAYYDGVLNEEDDSKMMCYKAIVLKTKGKGAHILAGDTLDLEKFVLAVPANGCLMIEAFLQDVKSGEVIVNQTLPYHVRPEGSINIKWNMGKKGKKGTFILTLDWSKGRGVVN